MKTKRQLFEKYISDPPFEMSTERFPDDPDNYHWYGAYRDINVDRAWLAFCAGYDLLKSQLPPFPPPHK